MGDPRPATAPDGRPRPGGQPRAGPVEERDRIEGESVEFHERVRQAYLGFAAADPDHYLVVDARLPVGVIAATVQEAVRPLLGQAKKR